ncbi:MAG: hypothetical protein RLZZ359_815, partial [Actinomycetota bacterium]
MSAENQGSKPARQHELLIVTGMSGAG